MPGPAPKKNARYGVGKSGWVQLPRSGRKGKTPRWPLSGRTPKGWVDLWKKPQAIQWELNGDIVLVARYLKLRVMCEAANEIQDVNASAWGELRQLEDRLGLSPMAMRRLQWEIVDDSAMGKPGVSGPGTVIEANDRFKRL